MNLMNFQIQNFMQLLYSFSLKSRFASCYIIFNSACSVISIVPNSLQPCGLYPARLLCPWDFAGKNIGVGCHFLLQGIFPTQESNPHLLSSALAGRFFFFFFTTSANWEVLFNPESESKTESEVTQSCPTLCNPTDYSLPGSSVHGIFQARVLEWVAISFSRVFS